jgi:hypothetical protein
MADLGDLSLVVLAARGLVGAEAAWMSRDALRDFDNPSFC